MIASFFHFAGVAFYAYFASGEKQPWADPDVDPATFGYEPGYPQGKDPDRDPTTFEYEPG